MLDFTQPVPTCTPKYTVECDNEGGFEFINRFFKVYRSEWQKSIVLKREREIIAAVVLQDFNGSNVFMHVAALPGPKPKTRELIYWVFHYAFKQLGAKRATGWVEASNERAWKFDEKLGFTREATLKNAGEHGGDVYVYVMHAEDCRHV